MRINDDNHQYARVTTITGDPRIFGRVYIGTNGRGIIYGDPSVVPGATYTLIDSNSGKALDVYKKGTADGTNVDIWTSNGGANQKWKLVSNTDGSYTLIDSNSGKSLDVAGAGTANGTNVDISTSNGGANQKWKLIRN